MESARPNRAQLKVLTSLRFFAAALVVLFHLQVTGDLVVGPWWYRNFIGMGYIGVNCFFVLSGFILVYTYAGKPIEVLRFWQARFARIYPAYAFSLLVTLPLFLYSLHTLHLPFLVWSQEHLTAAVILTLGLLQAWIPQGALTWNAVCWSLSAEAFFYLVFPLLLTVGSATKVRGLILGMVGCALVSLALSVLYIGWHPDGAEFVNSGATDLFWKNVLSFNPLLRVPEFITGVLAGFLFIEGRMSPRFANALVALGVLVIAALALLADHMPRPLISAGFLSPAFAALIFGLALRPGWVRVLEGRWLLLLGEASYSLYLLHSIVITVTFNLFPTFPAPVRVVFALAAAVTASLLCFALIEQPARRHLSPARRSRIPEAKAPTAAEHGAAER